jgi:hypothetical protein
MKLLKNFTNDLDEQSIKRTKRGGAPTKIRNFNIFFFAVLYYVSPMQPATKEAAESREGTDRAEAGAPKRVTHARRLHHFAPYSTLAEAGIESRILELII